MSFEGLKARTIICPVCKKSATEPFFGTGFSGWLRIMDVYDEITKQNPILCPECYWNFIIWLNGGAKIVLNETKKEGDK